MALTLPRVPSVSPLSLLSLWMFMSARALETFDQNSPELICSEGLTDCNVTSASPYTAGPPDPDETVNVTHLQLKVILCCSAAQHCEPCLQIIITVQEVENAKQESGEHSDEDESSGMNQVAEGSGGKFVLPEPRALVKVCLSSPGSHEFCRTLKFKPSYSGLGQASQPATHKVANIGQVFGN